MIAATCLAIASPAFAQSAALVRADLDLGFASFEAGKFDEALVAFESAAKRNNAVAQEILGMMYLQDERTYPGVATNPQRAVSWLRRAAANGSQVAASQLEVLEQRHASAPR